MTDNPREHPPGTPKENNIWLTVTLAAVVLLSVAGTWIAIQSQTKPLTLQDKVSVAVQALHSGYDQAAFAMLEPLATAGNPRAQYWLSNIYENGVGRKPDRAAAIGWLEKAAAQGFLPAERHLGELYLSGTEALQDFGKARTWLEKAAISGDGMAERQLGQIYALGLGVPVDPIKAYGWYENATLHGDGLARALRDDILKHMMPDEVAKGELEAKTIAASIETGNLSS